MVSAALAAEQGYRLIALTVDYNQRHKIELQSAAKIARNLDVAEHIILPLDLSRFGGSALTADIDVPKSGVGDDIPVTYVPARNLIFLSLTLGLAEARDARDIFIGVNALDYSGYPDCRPEFIEGFERLADLATKAGDQGSWSCYDPTDGDLPCGLCDSCRLRQKGFEEAGIIDPTRYAAA